MARNTIQGRVYNIFNMEVGWVMRVCGFGSQANQLGVCFLNPTAEDAEGEEEEEK